jgi:hypothetical protein
MCKEDMVKTRSGSKTSAICENGCIGFEWFRRFQNRFEPWRSGWDWFVIAVCEKVGHATFSRTFTSFRPSGARSPYLRIVLSYLCSFFCSVHERSRWMFLLSTKERV